MTDAVLRARLTAQLLAGTPATSAEAAVGRLLAVQGQDPRGFRLAVRARTTGVTAADVDAALDDRRLVVGWLNRGTLHLVRAEDFGWLHALTAPQLAVANRRRLDQEGVTEVDRAVDLVVARVHESPATRDEIRASLAAAGMTFTTQGLVHVLFEASIRHRLLRGPTRGRDHAQVLADDWLGPQPAVDRDEALVRLATRYLAGHGPASDRDLAYWANIPLRDARAGLAGASDAPASEPAPLPPPRLLGNFDPVLHGWPSRDAVLGGHADQVVTGGIFRSFALVEGRAAALWSIDGGRVRIRALEPLAGPVIEALRRDAAAVLRFLGLPEREAVTE